MGFEPMTSCLLDKRSNQLSILLKTVAYNNQEKTKLHGGEKTKKLVKKMAKRQKYNKAC